MPAKGKKPKQPSSTPVKKKSGTIVQQIGRTLQAFGKPATQRPVKRQR